MKKFVKYGDSDYFYSTMSYTSLTYHIVFSARNRRNTINIEHDQELYRFIYQFLIQRDVMVRRIGGMPDHVHILCDIPPKYAVAELLRSLKAESSKYLKGNPHFPYWDGWSEGYGAFTVDAATREARSNYIGNQKAHHAKLSFKEELDELLRQFGIEPPDR